MKEYIEKDKPFSMLKNYLTKPNGQYTAQEVVYLVDDLISDIPAADVVEVRHGRWTEYHAKCDGGYGQIYYQHTDCSCFLYEAPYNYCPNCGAKMDGGTDDA